MGGTVKLNRARAEEAIAPIAERLGISLEDAAESILKFATSTMASAILPMTTKRGIDPRDLTLIPFGGAGPTHACLLVEEINVLRILVPPTPGTMCAMGAAIADTSADYIRSVRRPMEGVSPDELQRAYEELESQARAWLADERPRLEEVEIRRAADMRYRGQAFNVEVELPSSTSVEDIGARELAAEFHGTYDALYGNADHGQPIELINLRVRITGKGERPQPVLLEKARPDEPLVARASRKMSYGGRTTVVNVCERSRLKAGHRITGPAIIEQFDTTTVVAPGFVALNDGNGNLIITKEGASHGR